MMRASLAILLTALLFIVRPGSALARAPDPAPPVAAPLPSKDIRWSVELAGAADAGSLPHASPGAALGFDVRRGALGFQLAASAFLPQSEHVAGGSNGTVGLFDVLAMICALAPIGSRFDLGACGGGGAGLLDAGSSSVSRGTAALRPEGLAVTRFDVVVVPGLLLSLQAGTVLDPLRTAAGEHGRSSLFAFRGSLGLLVRLW